VIRREAMVILPSGLAPISYRVGDELDVITIESRSGAWRSIAEDMRRLNLRRRVSLESFFSVAQMALAGFGHGLVPEGVAATLGVGAAERISLRDSGLHRPVRFVARKSMFSQPLVQNFYAAVSELAESV
jgi:DNA-binding transcriptional LysR family regulator